MTWNRLRHFHKEPAIIALWQRLFGPLLRWLTPSRRRFLLGLTAFVLAFRLTGERVSKLEETLGLNLDLFRLVLITLLLLGFSWACYIAAKRFAKLPSFVRRHPQISLHSILWLLLAWAWMHAPSNATLRTLLLGFVVGLPFVLWRLGYMLYAGQHGRMAKTRFVDHLAYIFPSWGASHMPYGKGWEYLSAHEAKDISELAKSQLAGLKLLLLSAIWSLVKTFLDGVLFGKDNMYRRAFGGTSLELSDLFARPAAYPIWLSWMALYLNLFSSVLTLATHGHRIIGWLRVFGFNVFRNTYKPLLAETVVEFWNRYYYYFKELLVNFFFYPTFARHFKQHPRIRIFAAVFAAAFAGNIYYHWLGLGKMLASAEFRAMWAALESRFFYCFLLALGISVSMLRHRRAGTAPSYGRLRRAGAIFGVWTFFSVIHIWAIKDPAPFLARFNFFLRLIGLT